MTLRCLREDLRMRIPPVEVDIGSLDHPLIGEARRLAPSAPRGQKRILSIEQPLVYRLRHSRWRGASWLEHPAARFWLCAGAIREQGSDDDAYEIFAALHAAGRLLPDSDDELRDRAERNARVLASAGEVIPGALAKALRTRDQDVAIRFGELVDARLRVVSYGEEVWVAIATQAVDGLFVEERLRDLLFALVLEAAEAEVWESRADWPSGELAWFEVARLGLRDTVG